MLVTNHPNFSLIHQFFRLPGRFMELQTELLAVAFICGYIIYKLGLPPLIGFLIAGLGMSTIGYSSSPTLTTLSDLGVTLLLFTIGLKLNIRSLLRPEIWGSATIHMAVTTATFGFLLFVLSFSGLQFFLNIDFTTALLVGFGLSFSSTVFAVKVLEETGRMDSLHGRVAIGVLIIQDIVAVIFLTISTAKIPSPWAIVLLLLLPIFRKLLLYLTDRVGHGELQVLFGLVLALSFGATVFDLVGLKADLGALILGILVAPHPRAKELANSLLNIKDLLLVGFFVNIGLTGFPGTSGLIASLVILVFLPLKMLLYFLLFTRFTLKARSSMITTLTLANYSEFGLIVCAMASSNGLLDKEWLVVMAIALSLSFVIASALEKYEDQLFSQYRSLLKRFETTKRHPEEAPYAQGNWTIAVIGMGRIGSGAYDYFAGKFGKIILGVDYNPVTVAKQHEAGRNVVQGDATDEDFYRRLPKTQEQLKLIVLSTSGFEENLHIANILKQRNFSGYIAAVAKFDDEVEKLHEAGVDVAFNLYEEAGAGLAAHIYDNLDEMKKSSPDYSWLKLS